MEIPFRLVINGFQYTCRNTQQHTVHFGNFSHMRELECNLLNTFLIMFIPILTESWHSYSYKDFDVLLRLDLWVYLGKGVSRPSFRVIGWAIKGSKSHRVPLINCYNVSNSQTLFPGQTASYNRFYTLLDGQCVIYHRPPVCTPWLEYYVNSWAWFLILSELKEMS